MKKLILFILVLVMISGFATVSCRGPDWKALGRDMVTAWAGELVVSAINNYGGDKDTVTGWARDQIDANERISDYTKYVNVDELVSDVYDIVWAKWEDVVESLDTGTSADEGGQPAIPSASMFPELWDDIPSGIG